ncbi:ArsR/SmtB family transcription factor [Rhodovibrio salinarum]|uniref:ArsR family transcriptional regulator n=1 Tax=Rhodovibrio salinarum TaxID=1087 RepID=A0A934QKZ3_9PROT|nr:metalloregulator ArsR/SmtB family transcription factor [Rhodovibrio salinarum]MBK1698510.1 ArsR family transcriptional regulator [Rhodovibrio salinarum]
METQTATTAFAALAQPTRLGIFRLLIRCAPDGCYAGDIAARLDVPPATLSFHLKQLEQAGLVRSRRESRHIVYAADIAGTRALLRFLTEDCCGGRPEICSDLKTDQDCEVHQQR